MFTEEEIRMFENAEREATEQLTHDDIMEINKNLEEYKEKFFKESYKMKKTLFHSTNIVVIFLFFQFVLNIPFSYILLSPLVYFLYRIYKIYKEKQFIDYSIGGLEYTKKEYLKNF
jgi:hypothetical protein